MVYLALVFCIAAIWCALGWLLEYDRRTEREAELAHERRRMKQLLDSMAYSEELMSSSLAAMLNVLSLSDQDEAE